MPAMTKLLLVIIMTMLAAQEVSVLIIMITMMMCFTHMVLVHIVEQESEVNVLEECVHQHYLGGRGRGGRSMHGWNSNPVKVSIGGGGGDKGRTRERGCY